MEACNLVSSSSCNLRPRLGRAVSLRASSVRVAASDREALRRVRSDPDPILSAGFASCPWPLKKRSYSVDSIVTEEEKKAEEEKEVFDGGIGKGGKGGNGGSDGGNGQNQNENNKKKIHDRYKQMLKSDPTNPLLLRNYGKFLHEVEDDVEGAEEMYGRALLENPADGEVFMLYGRLLWEKRRDKDRAAVYMDRAVEASPNDSEVLRARALFLWEAGEDEEDEEEGIEVVESHPLIAAF
ncbi:hypothetical protein LUZ60_014263 [Juncus effusus]|nr:hypothetical protein LUZ60_014263 [Juncus effusus]